jgi:hypothetical protein
MAFVHMMFAMIIYTSVESRSDAHPSSHSTAFRTTMANLSNIDYKLISEDDVEKVHGLEQQGVTSL